MVKRIQTAEFPSNVTENSIVGCPVRYVFSQLFRSENGPKSIKRSNIDGQMMLTVVVS
jgi:hypothetical protein